MAKSFLVWLSTSCALSRTASLRPQAFDVMADCSGRCAGMKKAADMSPPPFEAKA